MDVGGLSWFMVEVIGAVALLLILVWVIARQRGGARSSATTERATHDLYVEEERRHDAGTDTRPD